ncbi:hypothetical protein MHYP_G00227840 [Metynnis hypsauchen]
MPPREAEIKGSINKPSALCQLDPPWHWRGLRCLTMSYNVKLTIDKAGDEFLKSNMCMAVFQSISVQEGYAQKHLLCPVMGVGPRLLLLEMVCHREAIKNTS